MFSPCSLLLSELWVQVCGFLCAEDRLRLRAVCKELRDLVDSSALWRGWTVRLRRPKGEYNEEFWKILRRWRVTSAVLSSPRSWADVSTELPGLTSVIIDHDSEAAVDSFTFRCFSRLTRLYLRRFKPMTLDELFSGLPPQLQHLSLCEFDQWKWDGGRSSEECFIKVVSFDKATHLTNLTSLVCHFIFMPSIEVLPAVLSAFPHLTHLSVSAPRRCSENLPQPPSLQHRSLCSLQIFGHLDYLPDDVMKMVPCLRSLALSSGYVKSERSRICSWLRDLPALSSLVLSMIRPVRDFVEFIPSSVTHLALNPNKISPAEMEALSSQLPNLRHLHLEPREFLGPLTALVPQLFPRLHSLRIRHEQVPEEAFLSLATLRELQLLETQDPEPPPEELTSKLQQLTQSPTLSICRRPERDELRTCDCVDNAFITFKKISCFDSLKA